MLQSVSPLIAIAASPAFLAKGCVNVIELDALKESAGERWPRIREGVYARLETLLRAKLGPNDFFIRLGDTAYLITMPTTEAEDVSVICTRVAYDLHSSFLGQCGLMEIHVDVVAGGEDDALILNRLPPSAVAVLAERAGIADLLSKGGSDGARAIAEAQNQSSGHEHGHEHHHANVHRDVHGQKHGQSGGHPNPYAPAPVETPIVEHQFVPVWSVPNAAVTTYVCEPKSIRLAGRPLNVAPNVLEPKERLAVEMSALHHGVAELERLHQTGVRFLLDVTLSFDVFASPAGRMEVLSVCRNMSREYRSFITYVICNVPLGVGQTVLANMVTSLNPFGRGVLATIHPATRTFSGYQGIGLRAVGYNLSEFSVRSVFCADDAERLAHFSRRANVGTFLYGVRDKNSLKFAQDAGIQFLCGPAVAPPTAEPRTMWRLSWAQVLSKPEVELWV